MCVEENEMGQGGRRQKARLSGDGRVSTREGKMEENVRVIDKN